MSTSTLAGRSFILQIEESWDSSSETLVHFVEMVTIDHQDFHVFAESSTGRRLWLRPRYVRTSVEMAMEGVNVVVGVSEPVSELPDLKAIAAGYRGIGTIRVVAE